MKVEKIITTTEIHDIEITEVTLLSYEEYQELKEHIHPQYVGWFRSPGYSQDKKYVIPLSDNDNTGYADNSIYWSSYAVRPVLKISSSSKLSVGDCIKIKEWKFTVISSNYAICNKKIGYSPFREHWGADNCQDYKASDVKKFVDKWFERVRDKE